MRLGGPKLKSGYKSCSIELKGQGCRLFENNNEVTTWNDLFEFFLIKLNSNVTRFDIAIDDYDGKHLTIDKIKEKLDKGLFTTNFRIKDYTLFSSKTGKSLQFGSRTSTQMLVIYDKLMEQASKGNIVPEQYWTRFEMRFYQEKAYNVIMNIIKKKLDFKKYVFGLLYEMLDIKENNNYGTNNIHKAGTDPKWLKFVSSVKKSKIEKYSIKKSTFETYLKWSKPLASFYFLNLLLHKNNNLESTFIDIAKEVVLIIAELSTEKFKKVNRFLNEEGYKKINQLTLDELIKKLESYIKISTIPF